MKKILTVMIISVLFLSMFSIFAPQVKAEGPTTDFESGFGSWVPFSEGPNALVQVSTAYSHSPSHSLEQYGHSSAPDGSGGGIRLPVTSILDQYELSTWVYVTERSDADASSLFGFVFGNEFASWNPWGSGSSYVYARLSEGYQTKGDWYNPVPYGLTLNTWHQVKVMVYTNLGTVSIWLDGSLIVDSWPAFNAGEKPDYYDIECGANYYGTYVMHQYIDDVYVSEVTVVNQPPVAEFIYRGPKTSFTPSTMYAGSEVKFDAEPSYDPDGTIVSYTWSFGDGTVLTTADKVANHTYVSSGSYAVTLMVADDKGATGSISKNIFINPLKWEIYFEIDYMTDHKPTDSVFEYIHGYFRDNGVYVYFFVDDEISPVDPSVTRSEFWQYEATYNDVWKFDDRAHGDIAQGKYNLKEKWILFGTVSEENPTASGYSIEPNKEYGNYIFIADQANDQWASSRPVSTAEVETVALMHEIGHTIGILLLDKSGSEAYDNVGWSVMAELSVLNCIADPIRYSPRYWKGNNLEYYII